MALLCLATLWSAAPVKGQGSGQLAGVVRDATDAPLEAVTVTLRGPVTRVVQTSSDGQFAIQALPLGEYELVAALAGFAPARRTLRVSAARPVMVSLQLSVLLQEQTIVTAARTGERDVQTTPMAVSVLSGTDLQRVEARTVADIAGLAPSVTFSQNTGFAQVTIRGIGTNVVFAGGDPSSAVYIDGVYLARPAAVLGDLLDLERIEALRGPQGTLYGRNVVGGALNLITKAPTNELEASTKFVAGSFNTLRSETRLSGPLVRDRVLGSVAILRGVREGFVRDLDHADHPLGGEDVTALLGKLHVVFDRRSDLLLSADVTHQDPIPLGYAKVLAVKPGFQVDNPVDLHEVRASTLAESRRLQYGGAARFTLRLGPDTTVTSLTAFRKLDYDLVVDGDITELDLTVSNVHEIHHQWSQEVTISRQRPGFVWVAGLFFFRDEDRQPTVVELGGPRLENRLDPHVQTDSEAVFGQATIDVTSRVSATAGLRYSREHRTFDNAGGLFELGPPVTPIPGTAYSYNDAISDAAWTPKIGVDVRVGDNTMTYLSATRGFKSGGFNLTSPAAGRGFAPEWVWSYEGGLKTVLAAGRANVNVSAFQTDYVDLQVQQAIIPGVIDISNAAEATIRGVELEGTSRLAQALTAGGHLVWLDARYDRYTAVGVGGVTGDVAGHRLSNAPEWSARVWLEWNTRIGRVGRTSLRADARWQSTAFFTPFNDAVQQQRPYALLDINAEFAPTRAPWTIGVYSRNLTNANYITGSFSSPPPAIGGRPGDPRQVGLQLTIRTSPR